MDGEYKADSSHFYSCCYHWQATLICLRLLIRAICRLLIDSCTLIAVPLFLGWVKTIISPHQAFVTDSSFSASLLHVIKAVIVLPMASQTSMQNPPRFVMSIAKLLDVERYAKL